MKARHVVTALAVVAASFMAAPKEASAAGLNDPNCKPTPDKPFPAIVVHGQSGNFEGMSGVTGALVRAGYCVYAKNYGFVPGGANGQDHLATSADQINQQINQVLGQTKAQKVDVIGHSAGVGVLDNLILKKGGAAKVHNAVMFGGLHHPYAHLGIPKAVDMSIYLPNLVLTARQIVPGIKMQDVIKTAIRVFAPNLDPAMRATAESNFTADLFDPDYWQDLHGGHSEIAGDFAKIGQGARTRLVNDAAPNVCYTNIVAIADLLAGVAAGFQDENTNIDNFLLTSSVTQNAHNDMLGDPVAIGKMLSGLVWNCAPAGKKIAPSGNQLLDPNASSDPASEDLGNEFRNAVVEDEDRRQGRRPTSATFDGGCSFTGAQSSGSYVGLVLVAGAFAVRRRRALSADS